MKKLSTLYFTSLFIITTFAQAALASAVKDEDVTQYLDLSGLDLVLQSIPAQIQGMGQQMKLTAKDPEHAEKTMNILVESWDETAIKESLSGKVKSSFTAKEMDALLTWLNSDLAKKIKSSEQKTSAANFTQDFMQYMAKIQSTPPTEERVKIIRNFIESTNMVEHSFDMVMAITRGMVNSMNFADGNKLTAEQIDAQMQQMEVMLKPQLEQQMIYVSYYTYEELSDEDIETYTSFYNKPLGQKELSKVYSALSDSLNLWTDASSKNLQSQK